MVRVNVLRSVANLLRIVSKALKNEQYNSMVLGSRENYTQVRERFTRTKKMFRWMQLEFRPWSKIYTHRVAVRLKKELSICIV